MVEPSDNLQLVFEKAIETAKENNHEYLTIEHLLFAMLCEEAFSNTIQGYGSDPEFIKKNLEHYLKNKCDEITAAGPVVKPKKTQAVERVLNKAFTQVLFNGRQKIEPADVFLAMMGEKRSWAHFYIAQAEIDKDKFADYLNNAWLLRVFSRQCRSANKSLPTCRWPTIHPTPCQPLAPWRHRCCGC